MYVQDESGTSLLNLAWLLKMRLWAALGQATTVLAVHYGLKIHLPLVPLLALVSLTVLSNLAVLIAKKGAPSPALTHWVGPILTIDTLILSGLLYFSGGAANPFSIFYLVHIALSAVCLNSRWTWGITLFSISAFALLFVFHHPIAEIDAGHQHHGDFSLHLKGMWLTFAMAAGLLAYLVGGLLQALRKKDEALGKIQIANQKRDQLLSLATLAAGAAHELNTPLGTIALIAHELLQDFPNHPGLSADLKLIESQVARCKQVVEGISIAPTASEKPTPELMFHHLQKQMELEFAKAYPHVLRFENRTAKDTHPITRAPLESILKNLLKNALDASPPSHPVCLTLEADAHRLRFVVADSGPGMTSETLEKAFDPFFTTKPPGQGMGLGLFLSRMLSEQMGGTLRLESTPGVGTRAILEVG